jgi:hypothetical protein
LTLKQEIDHKGVQVANDMLQLQFQDCSICFCR